MIEKWCQSGSLPSEMRRHQPPSVPFVIPFLAPLRRRSGSAAGTDSADGAFVRNRTGAFPASRAYFMQRLYPLTMLGTFIEANYAKAIPKDTWVGGASPPLGLDR